MKNIILALLLVFGFAGLSYAGDCSNGLCRAPAQAVRRAVTITKDIVVAPVRIVAGVVANNSCCACGCSSFTKEVVRYQPLRRRLVNRNVNVTRGVCQ